MSERLLLHVCCGPCSIEPIQALVPKFEVATYYYNPNIQPREEYARRLATAKAYVGSLKLRFLSAPYAPPHHSNALGRVQERPDRCRRCYALRLTATACVAEELGFPVFTTTLLVSPYQDREGILAAGREAARVTGVRFLEEDFRDRFREGQRRARELGMYRQKYCGCALSLTEAEEERAGRKKTRKTTGSAV